MIRVLLVNEIRLMCNVLKVALEDEPDIRVVGCATSADEALDLYRATNAEVVLASTRLPDNGALRLVEGLTNTHSSTHVLVLGVTENKERVLRYVEAGASGYVTKDSSVDDLIEAIRTAHKGAALASPDITAALMERLSEYAQMFANLETGIIEEAGLTPRELAVLKLLGENYTNQQISEELIIEVGTVKNHVHSILSKLNVNTRDEAATYLALIKPPDQAA
jgi:DNA-binding NarL/FixJ family response regulator